MKSNQPQSGKIVEITLEEGVLHSKTENFGKKKRRWDSNDYNGARNLPKRSCHEHHRNHSRPSQFHDLKLGVNLEEITENSRIFCDETLESIEKWLYTGTPSTFDVNNEQTMLYSGIADPQIIKELWAQKSRMDAVFDQKYARFYHNARDTIFPQDCKGSRTFRNRAGDKFMEVHDQVSVIPHSGAFFDICGGPGSWSEALLAKNRDFQGYGITLKQETGAECNCNWYPHILSNPRWTPLWGSDSTGNVYVTANLLSVLQKFNPSLYQRVKKKLDVMSKSVKEGHEKEESVTEGPSNHDSEESLEDGQILDSSIHDPPTDPAVIADETHEHNNSESNGVELAVADGGFAVSTDEKGNHIYHIQELYSLRIIFSEYILMLSSLKPGGNFVCKLFDTLSPFTASIVYISSMLFDDCFIVKPLRSRIVNSERYLVGKGLKNEPEALERILTHFLHIHQNWSDSQIPISLVRLDFLRTDNNFRKSFLDHVKHLCTKQINALKIVMDECFRRLDQKNIKLS